MLCSPRGIFPGSGVECWGFGPLVQSRLPASFLLLKNAPMEQGEQCHQEEKATSKSQSKLLCAPKSHKSKIGTQLSFV